MSDGVGKRVRKNTGLMLGAKGIGAAMAGWLGWRFGAEISLTPDLDAIPALSAERDAQWNRIAAADFLDADEKRALLGFAPKGE